MAVRRVILALPAAALVFAGLIAACGDDAVLRRAPGDGGADAPPDVPVVVTNDTETKQSGKVIQAGGDDPVPGAQVTIAGKTATTNDNGDYELIVPRNQPYRMSVTADGYYSLFEQEWIVKTESLDWGNTNLLKSETANIATGLLPGRSKEKGLLLVKVNALPPCTSEEGTTLALDPPGEAKLSYFSSVLPDSSLTATKGGTTFSAIFYNVDVGVPLTVIANSPNCTQVAFPIDDGRVTYTGVQKAEPGDTLAYLRLYIRDAKPTDAGTTD